jgi:peptidyl-prolyl cis-trans isomerase C
MRPRLGILARFFAIGALLLVAERALFPADPPTIAIGPAELAEIRAEGIALFGRAPAGAELDALVEAHVADEILYREALARGLDREDRGVRRRLARNLAFLRARPGAPDAPAEGAREEALYREALALGMDRTDTVVRRKLVQRAKLEIAWLAAHPERALGPPRVRFRHLFFDPARRGSDRAETDARAIVRGAQLREPPASADPCLVAAEQPLSAEASIARTLGSAFAAALFAAPVGEWSGPVRSSLGWHAVRVAERTPGEPVPFAAVRAAARDAVLEERSTAALAAFLAERRARVRVIVTAAGGR